MSTPMDPLTQFRVEQTDARIQELFQALRFYGVDCCTVRLINAAGQLRHYGLPPKEKPVLADHPASLQGNARTRLN